MPPHSAANAFLSGHLRWKPGCCRAAAHWCVPWEGWAGLGRDPHQTLASGAFREKGPRSLRWEDRVSLAQETAGPPVAAPSSTAPQQEVTAEPTRASYRTRTAPQIPHQLVLRLLSRSAPDNPLVIPNDGSRFPRILCVPGPTLSI